MTLGIATTKLGMTQIFTEEGVRVPVTVLKMDANVILQKRNMTTDGYTALQIGFADKREKNTTKPMMGHFKKAESTPKRHIREFRVSAETLAEYEIGQNLDITKVFEGVNSVDATAVSKGKGFAGVMKRHNFKGFRATHGTHEYFRHGGSIGMATEPGKVFKGKKMPGQMGNQQVTTINLAVAEIRPDEGLIFIRGAVPGSKNGVVYLTPSLHKAKRGKGMSAAAQMRSKNPMKASKAKH